MNIEKYLTEGARATGEEDFAGELKKLSKKLDSEYKDLKVAMKNSKAVSIKGCTSNLTKLMAEIEKVVKQYR